MSRLPFNLWARSKSEHYILMGGQDFCTFFYANSMEISEYAHNIICTKEMQKIATQLVVVIGDCRFRQKFTDWWIREIRKKLIFVEMDDPRLIKDQFSL